jgi:hypothetical protein
MKVLEYKMNSCRLNFIYRIIHDISENSYKVFIAEFTINAKNYHPILAVQWKRISIIASRIDGSVVVVVTQIANPMGAHGKFGVPAKKWKHEMHCTVAFWMLCNRYTPLYPLRRALAYNRVCQGHNR